MDSKKLSVYKLNDTFDCITSKKELSLVSMQCNRAIKIIQKTIEDDTVEKEYSCRNI
tara:strand:+ start:75 stop:245 length:171 start_codon:yes stop_codon:yes gene_type:complete